MFLFVQKTRLIILLLILKFKHKFSLLISLIVALLFGIIFCSYFGHKFEENVRTILYRVKGDSVPNFAEEKTDSLGVPFVNYATENNITPGKQYNATIVANYAINYQKLYVNNLNKATLQKFENCILWLKKNATITSDTALYYFNWQQPWYVTVKGNFTSGISSGRAIEAFILASVQFKDKSYLELANKLLNGYYVSIEKGGFTYKENNGWWYEEIADTGLQTPRIIDGHIYAILGAQKLYETTKASGAKTIVDKGIEALKNKLIFYDGDKEVIYYDIYKKQADKKYRQILVEQMHQLYIVTGDTIFYNYYNKWNKPLQKNYVLKVIQEKNISGILLVFILSFFFFLLILVLKKLYQYGF